MAIRTNNRKFKSIRQNSKYSNRKDKRTIRANKLEKQKLKDFRLRQLEERKIQANKLRDIDYKRSLTINTDSENVILNRTQTEIKTSVVSNGRKKPNSKPVKRGLTSQNDGHQHRWTMFEDGTIIIHEAKHPQERRIKHDHDFRGTIHKGYITYNQSQCYRENSNDPESCFSLYGINGVGSHNHTIRTKI